MSSASEEVAVLERTRLRLAGVADEQLEGVLARVLPNLLPLLKRPEADVRNACLAVLAHVNQRLRATPTPLPLGKLVSVYREVCESPLAGVTTLMYIERAFPLTTFEDRFSLLDVLLLNASERPPQHRPLLGKLLLSCLPEFIYSANPSQNEFLLSALKDESDRAWILDVLLEALILSPARAGSEQPQTQREQGELSGLDRSINGLRSVKLSILKLLLCGAFSSNEIHCHELAALSDSHHEVVSQGEMVARRLGVADRDNDAVVDALFNLFNRPNISNSLKVAVVSSLSKSSTAPRNRFVDLVKMVFASAFDVSSPKQLVRAGLDALLSLVRNGSEAKLGKVGAALLQALLKSLAVYTAKEIASNADSGAIRCILYDAVAILCATLPHLLSRGIELPSYFFQRLQLEFPTVRHSLKDATSVLAGVYVKRRRKDGIEGLQELVRFLQQQCESEVVCVRLCALQWLNRITAFEEPMARFLSMKMYDDPAGEIKEEAHRGLLLPIHLEQSEKFPDFEAMVRFLSEPDRVHELELSAKRYGAALLFVRQCLGFAAKQSGVTVTEYCEAASPSCCQALQIYQQLILQSFDSFPKTEAAKDLQSTSTRCLLQLIRSCPSLFIASMCSQQRLSLISGELLHGNVSTREDMASLLHLIAPALSSTQLTSLIGEMRDMLGPDAGVDMGNSSRHGALLALGALFSRLCKENSEVATAGPEVKALADLLLSFHASRLPLLASAACTALGAIAADVSLLTIIGDQPMLTFIKSLTKLSRGTSESRMSESAVLCLGQLTLRDRDETHVGHVIDAIVSLANIRDEQLLFALGESLVMCAAALQPRSVEPVEPVEPVEAASSDGLMGVVLQRLTGEMVRKGSALSRCAASVWLLCLLRYSGKHNELLNSIHALQDVFAHLLSDSRALTQESASKGLAFLFELGGQSQKRELVRSLISTFSTGTRKLKTDDTQPDAGFSSYRELCDVANDMGRSDLVYRFMDLACNHTVWASERGAAFSLGSLVQTSELLLPNLHKLIPKLYRYQYDPNPKIRSTMKTLWGSLVPDPVKAVNENFQAILQELVEKLVGRQHRVRESSCVALSDLLSGRKFLEVRGSLAQLYRNMFLVLDDMQDAVRAAALVLARTVTSFTERCCDVAFSPEEVVSEILEIVLPLLLKQGIHSKSKEVSAIAVQTLVHITKASLHLIRPHLPTLIRVLLEALSSLEDQMLQYAMFHTGSLNITKEQLESHRLMMAKTSPIGDAIECCSRQVTEENITAVVQSVVGVVRQGTGLATLDGAAKFVVSMSCFVAAELMAAHSSALVSAFSSGLCDPSPSLRRAYASALAHICKTASTKTVSKLVNHLSKLYKETDDEISCEASANLAQELADRAQSSLEPCYDEFLPIAFIGSHDSNSATAKGWKRAWEECTIGYHASLDRYGNAVLPLIEELLSGSSYAKKATALDALAHFAEVKGRAFAEHVPALLPLLEENAASRIWNGQLQVLRALQYIARATAPALDESSGNVIMTVLQHACSRKSERKYKTVALRYYGRTAACFPAINCIDKMADVLSSVLNASANSVEEVDIDNRSAERRDSNALLVAAFGCLAAAWPHAEQQELTQAQSEAQHRNLPWAFKSCLASIVGRDPPVRVAALNSLHSCLSREASFTLCQEEMSSLLSVLGACLRDLKHVTVRVAALQLLVLLLEGPQSRQLCRCHHQELEDAMFRLASDFNVDVQTHVDAVKRALSKLK